MIQYSSDKISCRWNYFKKFDHTHYLFATLMCIKRFACLHKSVISRPIPSCMVFLSADKYKYGKNFPSQRKKMYM